MNRVALPLDDANPVAFLIRTAARIELMTLGGYTTYSREQLAVPVWEGEQPIARMLRLGTNLIDSFEPVWWNLCDSHGTLYAFLVTTHGEPVRFGGKPYQITLREAPTPTP